MRRIVNATARPLSLVLSLLLVYAVLPAEEPAADASPQFVSGILHPTLSPDGTRLAGSFQGTIATGEVTGGTLRIHTSNGGWDIEPAWSHDGKQVAFYRSPNFFSGHLRLLDLESGEVAEPGKPVIGDGKIFFSPDGTRILGTFRDAQNRYDLSWVDLASGERTRLGVAPDDPQAYRRQRMKFALAPQGERIYYAVHRDLPNEQGGNNGPQADVFSIPANGGEVETLFTWPARIYDLVVAPDGGSLVVVSDLGSSHNDLWRIPLDEPLESASRISRSHADDERPSLDHKGERLLYSDNFGGDTDLFLRDEATGQALSIPFTEIDYGQSTTTVSLEVVDEMSDDPLPCRVSLRRQDGKFHSPLGKLFRITGPLGHFYIDGKTTLEVPHGAYEIRVFRGLEYHPSTQAIEIGPETQSIRLAIKRWSNQAERNWYSGENHVHANYGYGEWYNKPESILLQCEGEDLHVCNTVIANSDGDAIFDREFFLGQLDPRSTDTHLVYFGQEFRSTIWGHMTLSNLTQLVEPIMTGFQGTTNPNDVPTNADIAQRVIDQGGTIGYTHPAANLLDLYDQPYAAKGLPVDAALGRVRLMDIHGHTYAGSIQLWYRLLNCQLRVIGSAGTDVFLNRVRSYPPGWARTFVHLPEGLSYSGWIHGQNEGRSFFTNGPMLEFEVNGKPIGSALTLTQPGSVDVRVRVRSAVPIDRAQLIHNGNVLQEIEIGENGTSAAFEGPVSIPESGWISLRASGPAHPDVVRDPSAHTNPIWITIPDHPNSQTKKHAEIFLRWIDRLEGDLKQRDRIPTEAEWSRVREQLDGARRYYESLR